VLFEKIFGKNDFGIFMMAMALAAIIAATSYRTGMFFYNASNFAFGVGAVYVVIGLSVIVKNIGLFRSVGYMRYRREFRRTGDADYSAKPVSYAEYNMEKDKNRRSVKKYFIVGLPFLVISYLLALGHPGL